MTLFHSQTIILRRTKGYIDMKIKSSSEQIYDYIVRQIEIGDLEPGTRLSEAELMEIFSVSRTPIREALIRLASDGIIQNASRKGFFIKGFNRQDVLENYFIIACLDSYAASLALGRLTDEDLNRMDAIVKRLQISIDQQDYEQYHDEQVAFHNVYFNRCGNGNLAELIHSLQHKYVRTTWFIKEEDSEVGWLTRVNNDHKEIVDCFRKGDRDKLLKTVFEHWVSSRKRPDEPQADR